MSEFSWWGSSDPDEGRELQRLKDWKDSVLWLAKNAPPAAWRRGIRKASQAQIGKLDCSLIAYVQGEMPKRAPTPAEAVELESLLPLTGFSPEGQAHLRELAAANPAWYLFQINRFVRDQAKSGPI